jgi:hypothetical protein
MPHVRICAGGAGQLASLPRPDSYQSTMTSRNYLGFVPRQEQSSINPSQTNYGN